MQFNQETLRKLSRLSRIAITPEEEGKLIEQLQKIVSHCEEIAKVEVDTKDIQLCTNPEATCPLRDDTPSVGPVKEILSNAPDQVGGMIRIPPVFT